MRSSAALLLLALAACKDDSTTTDDSANAAVDVDGDGYASDVDCNDDDLAVHPDAAELCDGLDNDCDGTTDEEATDASAWYADADGDGYGAGEPSLACDAPPDTVGEDGDCDDGDVAFHPGADEGDCADPNDYNCDGSVGYADHDSDGVAACQDCDDEDPGVYPGAAEQCDGVDQSCDGVVDEGVNTTFYVDADGDGYGDAASTIEACALPEGYAANAEDCDDAATAVHPAASEICDGLDNDCDARVDDDDDSLDLSSGGTWNADRDNDGYGDPYAASAACAQPAGTRDNDQDCDDTDGAVNPGASEVCDGLDNDCDGQTDGPDSLDALTFYADLDSDGYGDVNDPGTLACQAPANSALDHADCDDTDGAVNPGASERCDGLDNDCDGQTDGSDAVDPATWYFDGDGDLHGDPNNSSASCVAPSGYLALDDDCDDGDATINPDATEICDGLDNDCSGGVDDLSSGSCAAESCLDWRQQGYTSSGVYAIDPEGSGSPVDAYCDMVSDGGGWTLMSWTEDSSVSPKGVPYPSLAQCPTLNCARGSSGDVDMLNALINLSSEVGVGHTPGSISGYLDLVDYDYSGGTDFGSLAGFYLDPYNQVGCDTGGFATGTFTSISGPSSHDGAVLYLAQSFRYTLSYGNFDESANYIWLLGTPDGYCSSGGTQPATYLGNWGSAEYGPYLRATTGARAVYVR